MSKKGTSKRKIKKARANELRVSGSVGNEALGAAMRDLRSSNAAQPHIPSNKKGTRSVKNREAIKDFK